ncbi:MAG: TPM domain-containing protein, partial [Candidatus Eremiobacteraeota bacterium]|nr:TPM domain-containing protein [Candidatus Eremiobacteraeota bacterium]
MKLRGALCALIVLAGAAAAPALARDGYVVDQAGILSAGTVSNLNSRISNFAAQTHKEIVVQTVSSLGGIPVRDAANKAFTEQNVNGVLIFVAKDDRKDFIEPDRAGVQAGWFNPQIFQPIYASMGSQFKDGDYDGGVTTAVDSVLSIYRSHMSSLGGGAVPVRAPRPYANSTSGGFHLSMFWIIIMVIAGFLILRSIMRAMSAPRPPYGQGQLPPGAPGYGQQGYGPGYGGGMGGGGGG